MALTTYYLSISATSVPEVGGLYLFLSDSAAPDSTKMAPTVITGNAYLSSGDSKYSYDFPGSTTAYLWLSTSSSSYVAANYLFTDTGQYYTQVAGTTDGQINIPNEITLTPGGLKIDQLQLGGYFYDIDLPPNATPSIASLTASGNIAAASFNSKTIVTSLDNNNNNSTIPTSKAVIDAIGNGIIVLEENNSTTAGTWLAKTDKISSYVDGQLFLYKIAKAGASTTTLNITGSGGTALGAKTVYRYGTTKLGTQYGVGQYLLLVYNSTNTCFRVLSDYDANTTTTYGTLDYYFRPYTAARLTPYKIVALDNTNRVIPITTEQYCGAYSTSITYVIGDIVVSNSKYYRSKTNSNKEKEVTNTTYWEEITMPARFTPTTTAFKPNKLYFYNTTTLIAAGAAVGGQTLTEIGYNTSVCSYTFWASCAAYNMIYLQGTYNTTTGLFTLDTGANYYKLVPNNSASLTLSSYFTSGKDYILVGSIYSSANYFQIFEVNTMYHFDGTNLVPYDTYNDNRIENLIPTNYVSSVNNVSPTNGNVSLTIPATNVIPAESTANKILVSTATSGTAAWSTTTSFGKAADATGFLKIAANGTVSVVKSSSAGNASATDYPVVLRNDTGSIQTEKLAISSGTTTKVIIQYDTTDDCVKFIF